jgi:ribosome maturation factor RimP
MTKGDLLALVRKTAEAAAEQAGCELVDVEFVKEGAHWYLRVYIDKDAGISHEDCEAVNGPVSDMLDAQDPVEQAYFLEVSSPGLERPLKTARDYGKAIGQPVEIRFYKPIGGVRHLEGILRSFDGSVVTVESGTEQVVSLPVADIAKISRKYDF